MNEVLQPAVKEQATRGLAPMPPASVPLPVRSTGRGRAVGIRLSTHAGAFAERIGNAVVHEVLRGRAVLFAPVFLGTGSIIWFSIDTAPAAPALGLLLTVLTVAAFLLRHGARPWHRCLSALALVVCGMLLAGLETAIRDTVVLDSPVTTVVSGRVERREAGARGEWRYVLLIHATADPQVKRPPARISVLARSRHEAFALGEMLTGRVRMSPPSGPALPGLNDFAFSSYYNGIGAVGYFLGAPKRAVVPVPATADAWIDQADRWLFTLRDQISTRIRTVISGDAGAFAASIITGERRSMSNELTEALRLSGLAHITAISGLNMALAAGIFFVGLRLVLSLSTALAQSYPIKKFAASGALAGALCYLMISGYQVSAVRAFLMTAIMLAAVLFDRPAISLRNLALAAIVILVISPSQVMGPSFQMSFAATAALIAGYAAWRERPMASPMAQAIPGLKAATLVWHFAAGTVMTSLIGGLSTAVFAVSHFHRLAPHSLEANLMAMPIISLWVMPAGLGAMLAMPFGLDGPFLAIMGWGLELVADIATMVAGWGEGFGFPRLGAWFLPIMAAGLVLLTLLSTWLRHAGTALILAAIAAVVLTPTQPPADVLISEDGQLIGLSQPEGAALATNRRKPPAFIYRQWQQALQFNAHHPPLVIADAGPDPPEKQTPRLTRDQLAAARDAMRNSLRTGKRGHFSCMGKAWCVALLRDDWTIAVIDDAALLGTACDVADIVVTPRRTSLDACRSGARLISARSLRQSGSMELTLGDRLAGNIMERTAFAALARSWQRHRLYDWRSDTFVSQAVEHQ